MIPAERVTITQQGITLSGVVWRRFASPRPALSSAFSRSIRGWPIAGFTCLSARRS
jgi:hypothetical protein